MGIIGVGIIGASTTGWAAVGHVPAVKALDGYELRAISTSRRESADAAATAFGVPVGFDNHHDLINHRGVDLVVVAVKLSHHREIISAALDAGKMVYSEWPLANGITDATELADYARQAGVRTAIGLQGRFAPEIQYARDLIRDGYLGRVLGTTLVGSGMAWGPEVDRAHLYWFDNANGATTLTVPTIHALDALHTVLGEFAAVGANLVNGRTEVRLTEDGATAAVSAHDQVTVTGTLRSGAAASVFYRGGTSRGDNLRWEINGTDGDLVITSAMGNLQVADLKLEGGRGADSTVIEMQVPGKYSADIPDVLKGPPRNVAQVYARLAKDIREDDHVVPDFATALDRHRLVGAIEAAARTRAVQDLS